ARAAAQLGAWLPALGDDPVAAGEGEVRVADLLARTGHAGCAEVLLRRADARPGVRTRHGSGPAPACDLAL
ncbi:MAG: hypothetical protein HZB46_08050, partial [Solirubrobacterales bacterium]|nr:hypothetical protein [Solirubrobacterales bacterium]